jgi:hypothetical protein
MKLVAVDMLEPMVQQIQDMSWYQIILFYFEPDTGISIFLLVRKSIVLDLDLRMKKNVFVFFFFSSIQPNILCIKDILVGSVI